MANRTIDGREAWRALATSKVGQWDKIAGRFADPLFSVAVTPKFTLGPSDRFFCIGSCFARNVEEHLIYRGIEVLSKRIVSPREEWDRRPNGIVNKFTTHSMVQELAWLFDPPANVSDVLLETAQGWRDLHLCPGLPPASLERAVERRRYLMRDYFPRMAEADVVVMTLGLNEVWVDRRSGLRLNSTPSVFSVRGEPDRFAVEITDAAENAAQLELAYALLKRLNPAVRMVVTVSPVPMGATFSGRDIAVANMYSKSTLRAAAEIFASAHDDVDYFPSYEIVTLSPRTEAYGADCLHVADRAVARAIGTFLDHYIGQTARAPEGFTEFGYFEVNPDVEEAVRRGELASAYEHWLSVGQAERRPLAPAEPTQRMLEAGL